MALMVSIVLMVSMALMVSMVLMVYMVPENVYNILFFILIHLMGRYACILFKYFRTQEKIN